MMADVYFILTAIAAALAGQRSPPVACFLIVRIGWPARMNVPNRRLGGSIRIVFRMLEETIASRRALADFRGGATSFFKRERCSFKWTAVHSDSEAQGIATLTLSACSLRSEVSAS